MSNKDELRKLLEKLRKEKVPEDKISGLITKFGEEQFLEARKEIEKFLEHKDSTIRYAALSALVFEFGIQEHRKTSENFLINDPDEDNRALGASCLGSLRRWTRDKLALKLLLSVFKNKKEKWVVRDCAYNGILNVLGVPYGKRPSMASRLNFKKDVDWNLIESIEKELHSKKKRKKK